MNADLGQELLERDGQIQGTIHRYLIVAEK